MVTVDATGCVSYEAWALTLAPVGVIPATSSNHHPPALVARAAPHPPAEVEYLCSGPTPAVASITGVQARTKSIR
jgi:hypothetical protein